MSSTCMFNVDAANLKFTHTLAMAQLAKHNMNITNDQKYLPGFYCQSVLHLSFHFARGLFLKLSLFHSCCPY